MRRLDLREAAEIEGSSAVQRRHPTLGAINSFATISWNDRPYGAMVMMSLVADRLRDEPDEAAPAVTAGERPLRDKPALSELVPWFIVGFIAVASMRTLDLIPHALLRPAALAATYLTIVSMAALGLGVDIRSVARAGARVTAAVVMSLVVLGVISFALIRALHVA